MRLIDLKKRRLKRSRKMKLKMMTPSCSRCCWNVNGNADHFHDCEYCLENYYGQILEK